MALSDLSSSLFGLSLSKPEIVAAKLEIIRPELEDLETQLQNENIFRDQQNYRKVNKRHHELNALRETIEKLMQLHGQFNDNEELIASSSADAEFTDLLQAEQAELKQQIIDLNAHFEEQSLPKDPLDSGNAIVEIRAGAGGEESALFGHELYRAYSKYAERMGFELELANISVASSGGFKEAIFFINGDGAFGKLRFESGVHRVQRVPATEAAGRIHTSTVSIVVLPESPDIEVDLKESDLRVDVYRSSGPGGQSVNTTDSAVRIVHLPTGIIVTCQDGKSQLKNRAKAIQILKAKLFDIAQQEAQSQMSDIRLSSIKNSDRADKIRTYNFPQSRITDHRIKKSWHNINEVMEGYFDEIITDVRKYLSNPELIGQSTSEEED